MDERQWQPAIDVPIARESGRDGGDGPNAGGAPSPAEAPESGAVHGHGTGEPPRTAHPLTAGESLALTDPRALTILTTEHWSLLSARGLVYNESFARAGMFLTFMSGTFVALGLVSTASGFSSQFLVVTTIALALDLFVGLATLGRLASASKEDIRYLQGMNRLRHAYHEMVPGLEPYFVMGRHDDIRSVFATYEVGGRPSAVGSVVHGLTTTIGMVAAINAALGGILTGVLALLASGSPEASIVAAVAAFLVGIALGPMYMIHSVNAYMASMVVRFPPPGGESVAETE